MSSGSGIRIQQLPPRSEFRFELEANERLSIRLVPTSGDANVFGAELIPGTTAERWYTFGDECKACISSFLGCQLELAGSASTEYLADDESAPPSFRPFANLHLYLEAKRIQAREWLKTDLKEQNGRGVIKTLAESSLVSAADGEPPIEGDTGITPTDERTIYRPEGQGPRVMVLGPESSGKTSLIKFLANCALRSPAVCNPAAAISTDVSDEKGITQSGSDITGWWPSIISLDPSVGTAPLPCTISIIPLSPIPNAALPSPSPAFPYGITTSTTGSLPPSVASAHLSNVQSFWVGKDNMRDNEKHVKRLVDWLAQSLEKRLARDARARCSGVLIDMPGITTADARSRYNYIQYCVKALKVDTIVVLGHEKLNIEMGKLFGQAGSGIGVIKLPKSGGVVELDQPFKQRLRALQVRYYFYGGSQAAQSVKGVGADETDEDQKPVIDEISSTVPGHAEPLGKLPSLSPYSTTIPFDLLEVYKVGQENMAPSSALPIGASRAVTSTQLIKLDPSNSAVDQSLILNSVLALIQAPRGGGGPGVADSKVEPPPTDDEILGAPILGFIHV
jgi:polyribonucleotide 5'-hydroxyl-kinase